MREVKGLCPLRFREFSTDEEMQECIGERCMWHARCFDNGGNDNEPTNGTTSETNGITRGTNGDGLSECPHCGSVAEYVSEHAKGRKWAVACTMTSKVAADEGRPMCRCRTPFFRDKGQARDVWNRRAAVTDHDFAMAVHGGDLWGKCSECERVKNAEMVERDYVRREAYEDLRDEFTWMATFLHRMGKKCGTKDVPSLVAYVEQFEAERDELEKAVNELQKKQPYCYDPSRPIDTLDTIGRYIDELTFERDEWKAKAEGQSNLEWCYEHDSDFAWKVDNWAWEASGFNTSQPLEEIPYTHPKMREWLMAEHEPCTFQAEKVQGCDDAHSKAQSRTEPKLSEQSESLSDANDDLQPENDVTAEGDGANDGNLVTDRGTSEVEPSTVAEVGESYGQYPEQGERGFTGDCESDTREKLEADVAAYKQDRAKYRFEEIDLTSVVRCWLDRQASITEREVLSHPDERDEQIAELERENAKLSSDELHWRNQAQAFKAECEHLRTVVEKIKEMVEE